MGYSLISPNIVDTIWLDGLIFKRRQNGNCGKMINILEDFVRGKKQRVVLNGQCLSWVDICVGVPQGSILRLLLFLIYFHDLSNNIKRTHKYILFIDDTSLFSVVHDINTSANNLNHHLEKISECTCQYEKSNLTQIPPSRLKKLYSAIKNCFYPPSCLF